MNFEEALKKVKAGTATDEERAFVEERISKAQAALTADEKTLDFDEALAHVQDGTATDEEREYVKSSLADAMSVLSGTSPMQGAHEEDALENSANEGGEEESAGENAESSDETPENEDESALEFEEALEHVQQGTATERETMYVKSQMAAANAFFSDDFRRSGAPVREASGAEVKKAKKSFKMRYIVIPVCVVLIAILLVGAILGGVFGFAASSAHKNMTIGREESVQLAKQYVLNNQNSIFAELGQDSFNADQLFIEEVERHFNYNEHNLSASYYSYEIEVKGRRFVEGGGRKPYVEIEVKVVVNTKTGNSEVIDRDIDWD